MQKAFDHRIPYFTMKPHENQVGPCVEVLKKLSVISDLQLIVKYNKVNQFRNEAEVIVYHLNVSWGRTQKFCEALCLCLQPDFDMQIHSSPCRA